MALNFTIIKKSDGWQPLVQPLKRLRGKSRNNRWSWKWALAYPCYNLWFSHSILLLSSNLWKTLYLRLIFDPSFNYFRRCLKEGAAPSWGNLKGVIQVRSSAEESGWWWQELVMISWKIKCVVRVMRKCWGTMCYLIVVLLSIITIFWRSGGRGCRQISRNETKVRVLTILLQMPAELNCYFYSSLTTNLPKSTTLQGMARMVEALTWTTSTRTLMTLVLVVTKRGTRVREVMETMKNKNIGK